MEHKGKYDFDIEDWSKIKYMVKCHHGVRVDKSYPDPVIAEWWFETFQDMEDFVSDYIINNGSISKKIIMIAETPRFFNVETYEVATKVRVI